MAESGGNPKACSPVGAMGLFQLMPETAKELGVANPFDPDQCTRGGTEYDAQILAKVRLARETPAEDDDAYRYMFAGYNAGPGYVLSCLKDCRARGLPTTWANFVQYFPTTTVRGKKPDWKQATTYALKILPEATT